MRLPYVARMRVWRMKNISELDVTFSPGWSVLVGENGSGKTNILELLSWGIQGVTFRGRRKDLLQWGSEKGSVTVTLSSGLEIKSTTETRDNSIYTDRKIFDEPLPPCVVFLPQEEDIIDSVSGRRQLISRACFSLSKRYREAIHSYLRLIRQRNKMLRAGKYDNLSIWTEHIAQSANIIWTERKEFLDFLRSYFPATTQNLGGITLPLNIKLSFGGFTEDVQEVPSVDDIFKRIMEVRSQEERYKRTLVGPHLDTVLIHTDGRDVIPVLSRGQRRIFLLAFHIIKGKMAAEKTGQQPVYLFDDVLSELDTVHRSALASTLGKDQVFITVADKYVMKDIKEAEVFQVQNGHIERSRQTASADVF